MSEQFKMPSHAKSVHAMESFPNGLPECCGSRDVCYGGVATGCAVKTRQESPIVNDPAGTGGAAKDVLNGLLRDQGS